MNGRRPMGYAVVRSLEVLEAEPLQLSVSAQRAELPALAEQPAGYVISK